MKTERRTSWAQALNDLSARIDRETPAGERVSANRRLASFLRGVAVAMTRASHRPAAYGNCDFWDGYNALCEAEADGESDEYEQTEAALARRD